MPQRPTTHKDLHRAATGSVFSLVYALAILGAHAGNPLPVAAQNKLVKNETAKTPVVSAANATSHGKEGKLRAIPQTTLEGDAAAAAHTVKKSWASSVSTASKAETAQKPANGQKSEDKKPVSAVQAVKAKQAKQVKAVVRQPKLNNGLVPPPPPIMPIGMDALGMFAQPVDYLSLKELEARKKELSARLNELTSNVGDGERQIRERKERAELFDSLYQEGVVSRKELEIAKREAGEIDRDLKFKEDELESVKSSMRAVNNRLYVLRKMDAKLNPAKPKEKKKNSRVKN